MKKVIFFLIKVYKTTLSSLLVFLFGQGCRFTPTCSEYAKEAVEKFGVFGGSLLTLGRISRCHPFGRAGVDPVPERFSR
ncbi:MAG: membrane protein insertion efficiency factor YidD [Patescibacteria group bacterium]